MRLLLHKKTFRALFWSMYVIVKAMLLEYVWASHHACADTECSLFFTNALYLARYYCTTRAVFWSGPFMWMVIKRENKTSLIMNNRLPACFDHSRWCCNKRSAACIPIQFVLFCPCRVYAMHKKSKTSHQKVNEARCWMVGRRESPCVCCCTFFHNWRHVEYVMLYNWPWPTSVSM